MAKYIWYGGSLFLLALLATSFYVMLPDKAKIVMSDANTKFYVWENVSGNFTWVLGATETVKLYNGSKLVPVNSRLRGYRNVSDTELWLTRQVNYSGGQIIEQRYVYNPLISDVEQFPVSSEIRCLNCKGLILQIEYGSLEGFTGVTRTAVSPENFAHNVKIEWQHGAYYQKLAQLVGKDKLTIKYKINSSDQVTKVRMFDPEPMFTDTISSKDAKVTANFSFATWSAEPETAILDRGGWAEHKITYCSKDKLLYAYNVYDFPEKLNSTIYYVEKVRSYNVTIDDYGLVDKNYTCKNTLKISNLTHFNCTRISVNLTPEVVFERDCDKIDKTICFYKEYEIIGKHTEERNETILVEEPFTKSDLSATTANYKNPIGVPIKPGQCYSAVWRYKPVAKSGEWNATICFSSSPVYDGTCLFSGFIDPAWNSTLYNSTAYVNYTNLFAGEVTSGDGLFYLAKWSPITSYDSTYSNLKHQYLFEESSGDLIDNLGVTNLTLTGTVPSSGYSLLGLGSSRGAYSTANYFNSTIETYSPTTNISISLFVKPLVAQPSGESDAFVMMQGAAAGGMHFQLHYYGYTTNDFWGLNLEKDEAAAWMDIQSKQSTLDTTHWYHIVGTYNTNTTACLYVDGNATCATAGVPAGTGTMSILRTGIRRYYSGSSWIFPADDFLIDNIEIFNKSLSAAEVKQLNYDNLCVRLLNGTDCSDIDFFDPTSGNTLNFTYVEDSFGVYNDLVPSNICSLYNGSIVGSWRLNEATGSNVTDECGIQSAGVLAGNPVGGVGSTLNLDNAFDYDGVGDQHLVPDSNSLDFGTGDFTATAWIRPDGGATDGGFGKDSYAGGAYAGWFFAYGSGTPYLRFGVRNSVESKNSYCDYTTTLTTSRWYYVAVTRRGARDEVWLDGVKVKDCADAGANVTNAARFGINNYNPEWGIDGTRFNGAITHMMLFNTSLTPDQIRSFANYQAVLVRGINQTTNTSNVKVSLNGTSTTSTNADVNPDIVGMWEFEPSIIPNGQLLDLSGNGRSMSVTNGAPVFIQNSSCAWGSSYSALGCYELTSDSLTASGTQPQSKNMTYSFWVYDYNTTEGGYIAGNDWSTNQTLFYNNIANGAGGTCSYNPRVDFYRCSSTGGPDYLCSDTVAKKNTWVFYAVTYDGTAGTVTIYVDGVANATVTHNDLKCTWKIPVKLGRLGHAALYASGIYDGVRIYNHSLSASEVQDLYRMGKQGVDEYYNVTGMFSLAISSPTEGSYTNDNEPDVVFEMTDAGNCTLYFNGTAYGVNETVDANTETTIESNTTLDDGLWYTWITCDVSGEDKNSNNVSFTIDIVSPYFEDAVNESSGTYKYAETFTANITIKDDLAGAGYYMFASNMSGTMTNDSAATYASGDTKSTAKTITATHKPEICWRYWANDSASNVNSSDDYCFTMANTAPNVTITSPSNNTNTTDTTPTITFESDDVDLDNPLNCSLYFNGTAYDNNSSVNTSATTSLTANTSLTDAVWFYWVGCNDGSGTGFSQNLSMIIDTTAPVSTWLNQSPGDLTTTNVIGGLLFYYNVTDVTPINTSAFKVWHKTNDSTSDVSYSVNGTSYSGFFSAAISQNVSSGTGWLVDKLLWDNILFPASYTIDEVYMEATVHSSAILATPSQYAYVLIQNITSETYGWFEIMANTSGTLPLRFYYCNSSYSTGNPTSSSSCTNFYNLPAGTYNHTHSNYSKHDFIPFSQNSSGYLGSVKVSSTGRFLVRGQAGANNWTYYYITNQTGTSYTTSNAGTAWSVLSGTIDSHLHQFNENKTVHYMLQACDNLGNCGNSTLRNDTFNYTALPPTAPSVNNPVDDSSQCYIVPISWSASVDPNGEEISYYNISLLNSDYSFNKTLNENVTVLYYNWSVGSTPSAQYIIEVKAYNNLSETSSGFSGNFTLTTDDDLLDLYIDGYTTMQKWEMFTTPLVVANLSSSTCGVPITVCISASLNSYENVSCGENSTSYNFTIPYVEDSNISSVLPPCYQESANVSTACGGLSTGNYGIVQHGIGASLPKYTEFFVNYTIPNNALSATVQFKIGDSTAVNHNETLPTSCFNYGLIRMRYYVWYDGLTHSVNVSCYDSNWTLLYSEANSAAEGANYYNANKWNWTDENWGTYTDSAHLELYPDFYVKHTEDALVRFYEEAVWWTQYNETLIDKINVSDEGMVVFSFYNWSELVNITLDVYSYGPIQDAYIDSNDDGSIQVYFRGVLNGSDLVETRWDDNSTTLTDVDFATTNEYVDYITLSSQANITTVTLQVNATDANPQEFNYTQYWLNDGDFNDSGNYSVILPTFVFDDITSEVSGRWNYDSSGGGTADWSEAEEYVYSSSGASATSSSPVKVSATKYSHFNSKSLSLENTMRVDFNYSLSCSAAGSDDSGCWDDWGEGMSTAGLYLVTDSSGTTPNTDLYSLSCISDASSSSTGNISLRYNATNTGYLDVYLNNIYYKSVVKPSSNINIKGYTYAFAEAYGAYCGHGTGSSSGFASIGQIDYGGIGLNYSQSNNTWSTSGGQAFSDIILNTSSNIVNILPTFRELQPAGSDVRLYISANNRTNWQEATSGSIMTFLNPGTNLSYKVNMTATSNTSPAGIYYIKLEVIKDNAENLTITVGENATIEYNGTILLNATTTPINVTLRGVLFNDYLTSSRCNTSVLCDVPLYFTVASGTRGYLTFWNLTAAGTVNNLDLNVSSFDLSENCASTTCKKYVSVKNFNDTFELSDVRIDYRGPGNITVTATGGNSSNSTIMQIFYSPFNISIIPPGILYWDVGPNIYSWTQNNIPPYGNANGNGNPFWSISKPKWTHNISVYVKYNESVNTCQTTWFQGTNKTTGNRFNFTINTTDQLLVRNISNFSNTNISTWTNISCASSNSSMIFPYFCFFSMCDGCIQASGWNSTCDEVV